AAKEHPTKDDTCYHCKEVGHWKRNCLVYLAELLKKKKQVGSASSSDNCHYAPSITRGVVLVHRLPLSFWDYALESAIRILNMVPTKKVDKTPYELWYGKLPNLSYLKVWGCEALVKWNTPNKLQKRYVKCIFIGYLKETMGYYFYFPPENKIVVARDRSKRLIGLGQNGYTNKILKRYKLGKSKHGHIPMQERLDLNKTQGASTPKEQNSYGVEGFEPPQEEVILIRSMVWVLIDLPSGCKTVGSKCIFKKKTVMDGIVHTYKARLVAKGYTQLYGVDYEETFSPVTDIKAIRILISIAAYYDYEIWRMDVKLPS
nr:retrotransposon protein, putative, Ty1-copia subclass [Tanacetum cinerariifolium]